MYVQPQKYAPVFEKFSSSVRLDFGFLQSESGAARKSDGVRQNVSEIFLGYKPAVSPLNRPQPIVCEAP